MALNPALSSIVQFDLFSQSQCRLFPIPFAADLSYNALLSSRGFERLFCRGYRAWLSRLNGLVVFLPGHEVENSQVPVELQTIDDDRLRFQADVLRSQVSMSFNDFSRAYTIHDVQQVSLA